MYLVGYLIQKLAQLFESAGHFFRQLAILLSNMVPALLHPARLSALTRRRYLGTYTDRYTSPIPDSGEPHLMPWESDALDRYKIRSGRVLVLGSGPGREAIAMARRGIEAVGIDSNEVAIRAAARFALRMGVRAYFQRADFLAPPYRHASFDCVLLSSTMYSAIPGMRLRQDWLRNILRILKPGGLVILSFESRHVPRSSLGMLRIRLNQLLARLPGANPDFQAGDCCPGGHFFHEFQDVEEIRKELTGAGAAILELNWAQGFTVLASPRRAASAVASQPEKQSAQAS